MKQSTFDLNGEDRTPAMACGELPQQRFETYGASALSDTELIALLIHTGVRGNSALGLASQVISEAGSVAGLAGCHPGRFQKLRGIGKAKSRQLAALVEISRRMMREPVETPLLNRADRIAEHLMPITRGLAVEKFWVCCLNRKNRLIKLVEVTSGTATAALAHPREVFRAAIQYGATAVVCVHNHPSGDPGPSAADLQITRQLREAAKAVDIELLDHVIAGEKNSDPTGRGYFSFREAGLV